MEHVNCAGYNILLRDVNNLKEWSNEKDIEMEKQFLSLKESYETMSQHNDRRMDKIEKKVTIVAEQQIEMRGEIRSLNKNFSLLLRLIAGGILSGIGAFIFKVIWDIVAG